MAKKKSRRTISLGAFQQVLSGTSAKSQDDVYDDIVRGKAHYDEASQQIVVDLSKRKPGPKPGNNTARRALTGEALYLRPR